MSDELVSNEILLLAKEKGFNVIQRIITVYDENSQNEEQLDEVGITQSLLQKWLRETHKIHIFIIPCEPYSFSKNKDIAVVWIYDIYKPLLLEYGHQNKNEFLTYEDALENCLYECLQLIN